MWELLSLLLLHLDAVESLDQILKTIFYPIEHFRDAWSVVLGILPFYVILQDIFDKSWSVAWCEFLVLTLFIYAE